MDPWDFLKVANALYKAPDEASRRTAIGRAYYAAFNGIMTLLREDGIRLGKGPEQHKVLISSLQGDSDKKLLHLGLELETLRSWRNQADYEMEDGQRFSRELASQAIEKAARMHKQLDEIGVERLAEAVQGYLRKTHRS